MLLWVVLVLSSSLITVSCYSVEHSASLWNKITSGRNKEIRPVKNPSDPVKLYFLFHLSNILELNEVEGKFSVRGFFAAYWIDQTVSWDPKIYGVESLTYNEELLWKPTLSIFNAYGKSLRMHKDDSVKRVRSHGQVDWMPSETLDVTCEYDLAAYPFDSQTCFIGVEVEGYTVSEVMLMPLGTSSYWFPPHRTWDLVNMTYSGAGSHMVRFYLTLERKPMFFVFNLILPIVLMCVMNPFVFLLPAESGERVGFSLTVLLAIAVFLTISSSNLPAVSEPIIPSICILLFVDVAFSAVIVLLVIFTLCFYFKDDSIPVSKAGQVFVRFMRMLKCGCCRKKRPLEQEREEPTWTTDEYQCRGIKSSDLSLSVVSDIDEIKWKDVGVEMDFLFGIFSGIVITVVHLIYILVIRGIVKWG